ncbi:hypothetical protein DFH09DRAFT_1304149 [Mycena vulgaris]|nr:hypothetical protein DFH09DRAFT_1304149 [Mycena vulgaris]
MELFDSGELLIDNGTQIGFAAMPALTHLCLAGEIGDDILRRMLEECARFQILVNLWIPRHISRAHEIAVSPPLTGVRFFVGLFGLYWDDWELGVRGGVDFWVAADVFVARKRRGDIERLCYWLNHFDP